jgi:monoamine oxidase
MDLQTAEVIIIGAGASGLSAARRLSAAGRSVMVLEARNRIGGRIDTQHLAGFSIPVERGAEFIHGDLPFTRKLAREASVSLRKGAGKAYRIQQGARSAADLFPGMDELVRSLQKLKRDMPIGKFLDTYFPGDKYQSLREQTKLFVQGFDAADVNKASAFGLRDEWAEEDESKQYHPNGGYGQLMDFLCRAAQQAGASIHVNHVVNEVRWSRGKVEILTQQGTHFYAAQVILTVPPAVLRTGAIVFTPALPSQMQALSQIETGGVIKFIVEFNEAIWEKSGFRKLPDLHFAFSDAPVPTWWTQRPLDTPLLTGWLSGPVTHQVPADAHQLWDMACHSLGYLFGCPALKIKRAARAFEIVNWVHDPFALGAYTYKSMHTNAAIKTLSQPVRDTIFFAGEAFDPGNAMGTVEAALNSGFHTANRCLETQV